MDNSISQRYTHAYYKCIIFYVRKFKSTNQKVLDQNYHLTKTLKC